MIEPVMINIKTPQGWTLQPATEMRLSPHGGYRPEHVRTQKLSQLLTHFSLRERAFCVEICSGLPPFICSGQKPLVLRHVKDQTKALASAGGSLSLVSSFSQPTGEPNSLERQYRQAFPSRFSLFEMFVCLGSLCFLSPCLGYGGGQVEGHCGYSSKQE